MRTLLSLAAAAILAVLGYFWLTEMQPIGKVAVTPMPPLAQTAPGDWAQVLANAPVLKLTGFDTGEVEAGPEILIDATNPKTPADLKHPIWVPSLSYLVEHPAKGNLLLDTGLRAGSCEYGAQPIYWVPCRNAPGSDVLSQLKAHGVAPDEIAAIIMSHFHGDHASGLENVLNAHAAPIVTMQNEIADVVSAWRFLSGYESEMLAHDMNVETIDTRLQPMPVVGQAADYFGDGSLWLIPTPGHTRGHISMLVNTRPHPVLLTFDAAHLAPDFELAIAPGATVDKDAALASISKLRALRDAIPGLVVIYGHEPAQWRAGATILGQ